MFALKLQDLRGRILDCGAVPASFNAGATVAGRRTVLCDAIYRLPAGGVRGRVA